MMPSRKRRIARLVLLRWVGLAALLNGAACRREPAQTGRADLTVRALEGLNVSNVGSIVVAVTGPALPAAKTFLLSPREDAGTWGVILGPLPIGNDYVFEVNAMDESSAMVHAGSVSAITILKDQVTTVVITAQQCAAAAPSENAWPVIDSFVLQASHVLPGATIAVGATAHDPNPVDAVTFAWSASPALGSFSAASAAFTNWTAPAGEGDQTLLLVVSDGQGASTSASVVVHVSAESGYGLAEVGVRFNTWPEVMAVLASPGSIVLDSATALSVAADDADGDVLSYLWTSSCASVSFSDTTAASTNFILPSGATDTSCDFVVQVSDGRGGSSTGEMTLDVGEPVPDEAPILTASAEVDSAITNPK